MMGGGRMGKTVIKVGIHLQNGDVKVLECWCL